MSQNYCNDNRQLLQSIIDNTSNPFLYKRINGEYLLINKQFGDLFELSNDAIIGKQTMIFCQKMLLIPTEIQILRS
jgi:PAS domain-containing protein